jgi:predicted alpha/beta superfamily hydrolase
MEIAMNKRSKHWLLTFWLIGPFAVVVLLVVVIAYRDPSTVRMVAPAVGAGAGRTGGANAIGELLAGNKPTHNAQAANADEFGTQSRREEGTDSRSPGVAKSGEEGGQPGGESKLVAPESLPQGFILVVEDKARRATQTSPIYLASNHFGKWNAGAKEFMLTAQSDMRWRIELPQPDAWKDGKAGAPLEFKFTRGSWEVEELNADGSKPGNRTLAKIDASKLAAGEKPLIEISVAMWGDMVSGYKAAAGDEAHVPVKATGDLRRLQIVGGSGGAEGSVRECLVWLPAGYDDAANAGKKYPVLYMFDGQNLFEKHGGIPAEWGADETATKLIAEKKVGEFIIVGIPHGGASRMSEYLPVDAIPGAAKPGGKAFMEFVVTQLKPRVERAFRVETDRAKVGLGGSSLGAAMAMYGAMEYPEQFGLVLAESLPLRTGDAGVWRRWLGESLAKRAAGGGGKLPVRVALGYGTLEYGNDASKAEVNAAYAKDLGVLREMLIKGGVDEKSVVLVADQDAQHTESAWAKRLPGAIEFLLGKP